MSIIENLIKQIGSIPEQMRTPKLSDKEIEEVAKGLELAHEYEYAKHMEIK